MVKTGERQGSCRLINVPDKKPPPSWLPWD
jgi:hypothetical protein